MKNVKHVYWFAAYDLRCPSVRYRGVYPLQELSHRGISSDHIIPNSRLRSKLRFLVLFCKIIFFRKPKSIIVIQKVCSKGVYARSLMLLVLLRPRHTVYDLDDAEYLRTVPTTLHFFLRHCSKITVGSSALKKYALAYNKNVMISTSPVIFHKQKKRALNKELTIGWVGDFGNGNLRSKDFSHKTSMYDLFFPELLQIKSPIRLILIGLNAPQASEVKSYFSEYPNVMLEIPLNLNWTDDHWLYECIAEFDIGISPMVNHPFNECKSAFKAKQYLSSGIPVLASDIGDTSTYVKDGVNGYLCRKQGDFERYIKKFLNIGEDEYVRMSRAARSDRQEYSIKQYCDILIDDERTEMVYETKGIDEINPLGKSVDAVVNLA